MGEPIVPPEDEPPFGPVPSGPACANCWGIGKPFGNVDTPASIRVKISGVNKGPNWFPPLPKNPNATFVLTQIIGIPCAYRFTVAAVTVQVVFNAGNTSIGGLLFPSGVTFFSGVVGPCETEIDNAENNHFVGGSAVITIPDTT